MTSRNYVSITHYTAQQQLTQFYAAPRTQPVDFTNSRFKFKIHGERGFWEVPSNIIIFDHRLVYSAEIRVHQLLLLLL